MKYDIKAITNIDNDMNETIENITVICETEESISNMDNEISGVGDTVNEFDTIDGKCISGLQIIECYRRYEYGTVTI